MNEEFLCRTALFDGCTPGQVRQILHCVNAERHVFEKGRVICRAGEPARAAGLVLAGGVNIERCDAWGNRSILGHVGPGEMFAETYACLPDEPMLVDAVAAQRAEVLMLDIPRLLCLCPDACAHHTRVVRNLLAVASRKNLALSRRILDTEPKTIRGRLLSYLSGQALRGGRKFTIPFDRQQLADYLNVDRSALSAQLSKMRDEGLIRYRKNEFELLQRP